ncbi:MAG: carbohydrate kinase family protein, partial [Gammaproteobacteria bacterium]|nr:carbohydrate kinase family protein [Gammaproteobacteria bacterium]
GDAYRAGLLYGIMHDLDWHITGRIASLIGAIKIASHGPQNHSFTRAEFATLYKENFGETLESFLE